MHRAGKSAPSKRPVPTERLVEIGQAAGLAAVGVTGAATLEPARSVLTLRKRRGLAGEMQFTYRNPGRSTDPTATLSGARSLVAGALYYGPTGPEATSEAGSAVGTVARYARVDHYAILAEGLQAMASRLEAEGHRCVVVADTNGLVDRNVAWRAGIGWYGKNSNLLLPGRGSWFVLGAVVTDAELEPTGPPVEDGCGPCTRCIDDCPTGAIIAPGVVDARRCLAWIVQAPGPIPHRYREAVGDRLYGCDDCQDVCPPNRVRLVGTGSVPAPAPDSGPASNPAPAPSTPITVATVDLWWLLSATDDEILARHGRWYIPRREVDHLRRTALVVLGNVADPTGEDRIRLDDLLARYLDHPSAMLRAHAVWAARRLGLDHLTGAAATDEDPSVRDEILQPVEARFPGSVGDERT